MSAKKKKSKISKAEKERLQREEDEQRLKEEEEARLVAEREEQERLERECREQEEQQRLEQKDQERREDELNELRHLLEENQAAVRAWQASSREKAKWDRYMCCDGSPDPSVQPEINTFISLWTEDPEVQISLVLKQCALALRLTDELEALLRDQPEPDDAQRYHDTLLTLQRLIHCKHDLASEEILKWAKAHSDIETGNMQTVVRDENVTLCLWANLNKNPRFKGYQFQEVGLGFELPKPLAVCNIAVRILHTRYDHLSHLSRPMTNTPSLGSDRGQRNKTPVPENSAEEVQEVEEVEEKEGEGRESSQPVDEELQSLRSEGRKSAMSVSSTKEERKSTAQREQQEEKEGQMESVPEGGAEGQGGEGEGDSIPNPADSVIDSADIHIVDLQQYTPLGGVIHLDVFQLPPQSQSGNGWQIRELMETGLQVFPYPTEHSVPESSSAERLDESSTFISPPVGVTVTLPDTVLFLEEPLVARWDPVGQHWRTDGISRTVYNEAARSVAFTMDAFGAFTLLQETHANMPFQSWELRPLDQDSALFTVSAALIELSITIQGSQCRLQAEQAELAHIVGRWMSPSDLQRAMCRAGVNIFVTEHSDKYVSINAKDPLIEHAVYEQMALLSSAVAFSWSRWNAQCGSEHLVLQACEQLEVGPVPEEAWHVYLQGAQRSQRLMMSEWSENFSAQLDPGSEFHSTFLHMLQDRLSTRAQVRTSRAQHLYTDTVQQLLFATRPLTYS